MIVYSFAKSVSDLYKLVSEGFHITRIHCKCTYLANWFCGMKFSADKMIRRPCWAQPIKQPWSGVTKFSTSFDNSLNMFSKLNNYNTLHMCRSTKLTSVVYAVNSCITHCHLSESKEHSEHANLCQG